MPRVSQQLATQIARKLMEKKRTLQSESKKQYQEYFTTLAESKVPKDVMEFFKKHSEYVKTTSTIHIDGKGFNRENISLIRSIPSVSPNCYYEHIDLSESEASKGKKILEAHNKLVEKNNDLENEIETALLNLRTFANIEKELPEAAQYLPEQGLTVIVDTDKLRKKLKVA